MSSKEPFLSDAKYSKNNPTANGGLSGPALDVGPKKEKPPYKHRMSKYNLRATKPQWGKVRGTTKGSE